MGGLLSNAMRVLKTYNIEQRAMNALSENRKVVPPKHPTTAPIIEQMKIDYAEKMEELQKKNEDLDKNLKSVYVKSVPGSTDLPRNIDMLPKRTRYESPFEYGYQDPETAPPGRYTLTQIVQILTEYHEDRDENSAKKLAIKYNIDEKHLNNIIEYYKLFKLGRRPDKARTLVGVQWSKEKEIGIRNIKRISRSTTPVGTHDVKKLSGGEEKET
ncbi:unnamed protein product [Bemisia tabaci]|uniref:Protein NDUFAF4 homolog n=1 Tax=Bemisia tabaci TaxID=7038 RepID=A0A9P0AIA5_BEMTA|nr:unnamed protein product [Bemisia tabaci]